MSENLELRGNWTSASSAEADSLCAGRHLAQAGIKETESDDAAFGTRVHAALANVSPRGLTTEEESIYDGCMAIEAKLLSEYFPNAIGWDGMPFKREGRIWISWEDGLRHSGMADVTFIVGSRALIIDYKALPGDKPESSRNMQLRDLATLLKFAMPSLTEVAVAIVQPLVTYSPQICLYNEDDLARSLTELYFRVKASNAVGSPRTAGEVQCKFCRARRSCHEYAKFAGGLTPAVTNTEGLSAIPFEQWTPDMRKTFMDRVGIAEKWLEDCKERLREMMVDDPASVPGYVLKDGATKTEIINPQSVFHSFLSAGGTQDQFMGCVSIGKTALKDQVKLALNLKGKALDQMVDGIIGENRINKQNRPSITKAK